MYKIINLTILILLSSCTINKNIEIKEKSQSEIIEFYKNQGIESFLYVKDFNSMVELDKMDRLTIPQNLIFDENGYEILHFNEKLCVNHTLEFLKKYNSNTVIKTTDFNLKNYLNYFKKNDGSNINDILNSRKIKVFLNTATFGSRIGVNQEAFKIHKEYSGKFDIYIVNIDKNIEWVK